MLMAARCVLSVECPAETLESVAEEKCGLLWGKVGGDGYHLSFPPLISLSHFYLLLHSLSIIPPYQIHALRSTFSSLSSLLSSATLPYSTYQ